MLPVPFHIPIIEDASPQRLEYDVLVKNMEHATQKITELRNDILQKKGELREQAEISLAFWELNLKTWTDALRKELYRKKYYTFGTEENTTLDIDHVVLE